mmetsp:Transcript_10866/g.30004  ORF Transcript_10866/g.30004 Transcript_10866/m.30004 type:complete len:80 (-) Transcript_10866:1423-1662(-)
MNPMETLLEARGRAHPLHESQRRQVNILPVPERYSFRQTSQALSLLSSLPSCAVADSMDAIDNFLFNSKKPNRTEPVLW